VTYVLAAYGVTIVALVGYAIQLLRERKRLLVAAEDDPRDRVVGG
jgi:heme exporter protein CcmD